MKWYLLFLFLLITPFVYANSISPAGVYNIYLDGQLLDDFNLSLAFCRDDISKLNLSYFIVLDVDLANNCTWLTDAQFSDCSYNPCQMYSFLSGHKLYLSYQNSSILTDVVTQDIIGKYDLFISSDGSVRLEFIEKIKNAHSGFALALILFVLLPLLLLNTAIETGVAAIFFRKHTIPYKKLWWIVIANVITYLPFLIFLSGADIFMIIIAEIIIIIFEASFFKWNIKELDWNNAFILSLLANTVTIVVSILKMVFL
jgi:hypothetical protein